MMAISSAVVLNHRVVLRSSEVHASVGPKGVLYIANRDGAVILPTEDDHLIMRENERMGMLGYVAFRPGSVAERNSGHALFDQSGVPERARIVRELTQTKSAVIQSVVSVRREDAEALHLSTRQDWERLIRGRWQKHIEDLGVIAPESIRWVSAMHQCEHSLHCHVYTWDASGRFNALLPKAQLVQAHGSFVSNVVHPVREELNAKRMMARDGLVVAVRAAVREDSALRARVAGVLPNAGSLKHASLEHRSPEAARMVSVEASMLIARDPALSSQRALYLDAAREHARLKALSGEALAVHMLAAKSDIDRRVANALISASVPERLTLTKSACFSEADSDEVLLKPGERRHMRMVEEEASSLLCKRERAVLASVAEQVCRGEKISDEAVGLMSRLPSLSPVVDAFPSASGAMRLAGKVWRAATRTVDTGYFDPADQAAASALKTFAAIAVLGMRYVVPKAAESVAVLSEKAAKRYVPSSKI